MERRHLRHEVDAVQGDVRPDEIPVRTVWKMVVVDVNFLGPHDRHAGPQGQVVHQVEGLDLREETDDKVGDRGDPGVVHARRTDRARYGAYQ